MVAPAITGPLLNYPNNTGPEVQLVQGNYTNNLTWVPKAKGGQIDPAISEWRVRSLRAVTTFSIRYELSPINTIPPTQNQLGPINIAALCVPLDSDNDGVPNYLDTDSDEDGCFDALEATGTIAPFQVDSNGGITGSIDSATGIPTLIGAGQSNSSAYNFLISGGSCDDDGDLNSNADEVDAGTDPNDPTSFPDADGDGISDGQEQLDNTDSNDDCDSVGGTPLGTSDCDGDGTDNATEIAAGTDPNDATSFPDADGDGISDGQEITDDTDPNDDCDSVGGTPRYK